jgi:putative endonuclease
MELIHSTTAVYIMSNRRHGTLYTGVSGRFLERIVEHRDGLMEGFTKRYGLKRLVWFEMHDGILTAIPQEKSIKKYPRDWKINLIERENPYWEDLFPTLIREDGPLSHLQQLDWR